MSMKASVMVNRMADHLDQQGKPGAEILVAVTRSTLMKDIKPVERGGPLYVRGHKINHKPRVDPNWTGAEKW